jgi:hypothetical protein
MIKYIYIYIYPTNYKQNSDTGNYNSQASLIKKHEITHKGATYRKFKQSSFLQNVLSG